MVFQQQVDDIKLKQILYHMRIYYALSYILQYYKDDDSLRVATSSIKLDIS